MRWHPSIKGPIQYFGHRRDFDVPPTSAPRWSDGSAQSNQVRRMLAALAVTILPGCSVHPIPDDVSPIPTQAIVAAARCEMRLGIVERVRDHWFPEEYTPIIGFDPNTVADDLAKIKKRYPGIDMNDWRDYMNIAVSYDWTFDITEINHADSNVGFKLPFVPPGTFDLTASGSVHVIRKGKRTFKNQDKFENLLTKEWKDFCEDRDRENNYVPNQPVPRERNLIYPITGSIGLRQAVNSFLNIAQQEGGLDTFTDELTFTTTVDGKLGASVTLSPVPNKFRLVNGGGNLNGNRMDLHNVKISLAFPTARPAQKATPPATPAQKAANPQKKSKPQTTEALLNAMETQGGYKLNPSWRATYALCVADGRSREDELRILRLDPPEVTCLDSTDAFFPRGNGVNNSLRTGRREDFKEERRILEDRRKPAAQPSAPPAGTPDARPQ